MALRECLIIEPSSSVLGLEASKPNMFVRSFSPHFIEQGKSYLSFFFKGLRFITPKVFNERAVESVPDVDGEQVTNFRWTQSQRVFYERRTGRVRTKEAYTGRSSCFKSCWRFPSFDQNVPVGMCQSSQSKCPYFIDPKSTWQNDGDTVQQSLF